MNNCKTETETERDIGCVSGKQFYLIIKRIQDVLLSALALAMLLPLMLLISIFIVLDDPHGGPLYSQIRCGKEGKEFRFYKFRTMCANAEEQWEALLKYNEMNGPAFKIKMDPRITRFGKFLRKTSMDELPQLINVLKGDMSLVGPRPALPREVEQYTVYQRQRLKVTPGMTCYWQINKERYRVSFDEWAEMDIQYIQEQSWLLDWKLIFRTIGVVLRGEGE